MSYSPAGSRLWLAACVLLAVGMFAAMFWRLERGDEGLASLNASCALVFLFFARREHALLRRDSVSTFWRKS